ncbi:MAG: type II secretion system GspH family protein, partial [Phycisphaerales bacterium]|nr:type II secretion system GspH family protein [Phycisphaerales bacterium]
MKNQRALTLVEVLASIVLLTILAATCVPLLRAAMRTLGTQDAESASMAELGLLANKLLDEPAAFDIEDLQAVQSTSIPWLEHPERDSLQLELLTAAESADTEL